MRKTQNAPATRCQSCKRPLRAAASITQGMGRTCARKARQEAAAQLAGFKAATVAKARELIADGGIVPVRGRRVFRAVSSDGTRTYLTAKEACTCAAGLKGKHACFHRAAATLLAA